MSLPTSLETQSLSIYGKSLFFNLHPSKFKSQVLEFCLWEFKVWTTLYIIKVKDRIVLLIVNRPQAAFYFNSLEVKTLSKTILFCIFRGLWPPSKHSWAKLRRGHETSQSQEIFVLFHSGKIKLQILQLFKSFSLRSNLGLWLQRSWLWFFWCFFGLFVRRLFHWN